MAALARGRRQARQVGGDLILAAPQQTVMRVLATRLTDAFSVYGTVEEAAGETRQFRGPATGRASERTRMSLTP